MYDLLIIKAAIAIVASVGDFFFGRYIGNSVAVGLFMIVFFGLIIFIIWKGVKKSSHVS